LAAAQIAGQLGIADRQIQQADAVIDLQRGAEFAVGELESGFGTSRQDSESQPKANPKAHPKAHPQAVSRKTALDLVYGLWRTGLHVDQSLIGQVARYSLSKRMYFFN
jgi:hypothetical protein